jgi:DNA-binding transcriptional ArsR family regulator
MNTPSSEEVYQLHTHLCSALADPSRLLILYALAEQPRTVNELAQALGLGQSAASRHLKTLRERGVVRASRQGTSVEYSLEDERLIQALDLLRQILRDNLARRASLVLSEAA